MTENAELIQNGPAALSQRMSALNPHLRACKARKKKDGLLCPHPAMRGQLVCRIHGGKAPAALAKAAERTASQRAIKILEKEGYVEPVTNPTDALAQLAGEVIKVKDILAEHVADLTQLRYESDGGEQIRGELQAYERALDRSVHILGQMAKLNIEERQQRLREGETRIIASVFIAVFADPALAMTPETQILAKEVANRHLRLVGAKPRTAPPQAS